MTNALENQLLQFIRGQRCVAWDHRQPETKIIALGEMGDVSYAAGQMACLVAAFFKQELQRGSSAPDGIGLWPSDCKYFPTNITVETLFAEVGKADSPTVLGMLVETGHGFWPEKSKELIRGYTSAYDTMIALVDFFRFPSHHPTVNLTSAQAKSMAVRVRDALKRFNAERGTLHNQPLFDTLHGLMGCSHLISAQHIELA
jgi:hypothetical protein